MQDDWEDKTVVATSIAPAAPLSGKRAQLVVLAGANVGEMYSLFGTLSMGRGRDADIRIQGDGISRQHARIHVSPAGVVLEDLGSTNGSFVNGERVVEQCPLNDGDKIQLGGTTILKLTYQDDIDEDFQRQMFESASRDALTQIYNKRFFVERLHSEHAFSIRHKAALSLVMFDIDHFKRINDSHGHAAGDEVLATIGALFNSRFRQEDLRGRWGGEEFVVAFFDEWSESARQVLSRASAELASLEFSGAKGKTFSCTMSAGIAAFPVDGQNLDELFRAADARLYHAKASGRNRIVI